jgi:hypothetical protein
MVVWIGGVISFPEKQIHTSDNRLLITEKDPLVPNLARRPTYEMR